MAVEKNALHHRSSANCDLMVVKSPIAPKLDEARRILSREGCVPPRPHLTYIPLTPRFSDVPPTKMKTASPPLRYLSTFNMNPHINRKILSTKILTRNTLIC